SIILSSCGKGNDVARVEPVADEVVKTEPAAPRDESALTEARIDPPLTAPISPFRGIEIFILIAPQTKENVLRGGL
ncbi:MAG: hypothetical protein LE168_01985, partial [Endomicrobium sp.]|nr:hypothetical protein [Endomicrobium sp.]